MSYYAKRLDYSPRKLVATCCGYRTKGCPEAWEKKENDLLHFTVSSALCAHSCSDTYSLLIINQCQISKGTDGILKLFAYQIFFHRKTK